MRILVVENFAGTGLGQIATALAEAGAEWEMVRPYLGEALPDTHGRHDGLVVLGGGQNALADSENPHFPALLGTMRDFTASGRAVLGVCLGAQLLARAFGARNLIGTAPEFGWSRVAATQEGRLDPLLRGLAEEFTTFQWHDDTFTLPGGAVRLAGSPAAANQAFRIGRAAYGMQFHFEADRKLVAEWSMNFAEWLAERQPDWPGRHGQEAARHGPEADRNGLAIARAWVALV